MFRLELMFIGPIVEAKKRAQTNVIFKARAISVMFKETVSIFRYDASDSNVEGTLGKEEVFQ